MPTSSWSGLTEEGKLEVYLQTGRGGGDSRKRYICALDARSMNTAAERARGYCDYCAQLFQKDD